MLTYCQALQTAEISQILVKACCLKFRVLNDSVGLPQSGSERFGKLDNCGVAQLPDLAIPNTLGKT